MKFPDYVSLGDIKLRHVGKGEYFRDAGCWYVNAKWSGEELVCSTRTGHLAHTYGKELTPVSRKEWAKDNKGYTSANIAERRQLGHES